MSSETIRTRIDRDGRMYRQSGGEWIEIADPPPAQNFPEGEPVFDPENPPLTAEQLARMRPMSPVKRLRWSLGLSREDFARRYQIPLTTLRDWEIHASEPDATARAYLTVIASDPAGTAEKLLKKEEMDALAQ